MIKSASKETLERVYSELQQELGYNNNREIKSVRIKKKPNDNDKGWLS